MTIDKAKLRQDADTIFGNGPGLLMAIPAKDVRELLGEIEQLEGECDKAWRHGLNDRSNVQALAAEVSRLQAENERLRREREGKVLCDLDLFETLRDSANTEADEHRQCMATYRPLRQENLDAVVKKCDDLLAVVGKESGHD